MDGAPHVPLLFRVSQVMERSSITRQVILMMRRVRISLTCRQLSPHGLQKVNRKVVMDGMNMFAQACLSYGDKQSTKELLESEIKYGLIDFDASSHAELMKYVDVCKHLDAYVEEAP